MRTSPQELALEFDHIYRQSTIFTRKGKLPPEIFVKFTRRFMRDTILKQVQDKELEIKGTKICILKEIPWHIGQQQKEYFFFPKLLIDNKIEYQ